MAKQTTFGAIAEGVNFSFVGDPMDYMKTSETDCYNFHTNSFRCVSEGAEVVVLPRGGTDRVNAALRHHIGSLSILQRFMR